MGFTEDSLTLMVWAIKAVTIRTDTGRIFGIDKV